MKSIKNKFILIIIVIILIVLSIVSGVFLYSNYNNSSRQLEQIEKQMRKSYDDSIKQAVQIVISDLDIINNQIKEGILTEEDGKKIAGDIVRGSKYGEGGYFWADDLDGVCMAHPNTDFEGQNRINIEDKKQNKMMQNLINEVKNNEDGYTEFYFPKQGGDEPLPKRAYSELYEPFGWIISTGNYVDDIDVYIDNEREIINKNLNNTMMLILGAFLVSIIIGSIIAIYISKSITNPINKLLVSAKSMADGNLDISIDVKSKDEIGALSEAFLIMADNMNMLISEVKSASEQVSSGSKQVSDSSMALSQGATEQASSVEELSATIEEISVQVKQNAENALEAQDIANNAQGLTDSGNKQMKQMLDAMDEINQSSNNISKIIKVIDDIAFQTNILALNAAVEAARAGQHGKGFAVVAEEVRNLAQRSAEAAKETTALIEGSIDKVKGGTEIATDNAANLDKIVEEISKVTKLVEEIASASNEQSMSVEQINKGISQISDVVQTTSATSEETASASEELSSQAGLLKEKIKMFKLKDNYIQANFEVNNNKKQLADINPDVLKMIERLDTNESKKINTNGNKIIRLSDNDFGKY